MQFKTSLLSIVILRKINSITITIIILVLNSIVLNSHLKIIPILSKPHNLIALKVNPFPHPIKVSHSNNSNKNKTSTQLTPSKGPKYAHLKQITLSVSNMFNNRKPLRSPISNSFFSPNFLNNTKLMLSSKKSIKVDS